MKTQGAKLWKLCKRRPMTYLDLALTCISTSAHKRLAEYQQHHAPDCERLVRVKNKRGLVAFRVIRVAG